MERKLHAEFRIAQNGSLFFCKSNDVQRKLVVRWANDARTKAAAEKDSCRRAKYEAAVKRLQIMDSAINLHRRWTHRGTDTQRAFVEFESQMAVLMSFAAGAPSEKIECCFIFDLQLQLKAMRAWGGGGFGQGAQRQSLQKRRRAG